MVSWFYRHGFFSLFFWDDTSHPCSLFPFLLPNNFSKPNPVCIIKLCISNEWKPVGILSVCHFSRCIDPWKHIRELLWTNNFSSIQLEQSDTCLIKTLVIICSRNSSSSRNPGETTGTRHGRDCACSHLLEACSKTLLSASQADTSQMLQCHCMEKPPKPGVCVPHVTPTQSGLLRTATSSVWNLNSLWVGRVARFCWDSLLFQLA